MIVAMMLAAVLLFGWPILMHKLYPNADKPHAAPAAAPAGHGPAPADPTTLKPTREGGLVSAQDAGIENSELKHDLSALNRVPVAAPALTGSIDLAGGVIDDLTLNRHKATLAKDSGPMRMFSPQGTVAQHFAQAGWVPAPGTTLPAGVQLPSANTAWTAPAGAKLTPATPVTLSWSNTTGQTFTLTYAIDQDYLITITQGVVNKGTAPLNLAPYAFINRTDRTAALRTYNVRTGPFGAFDGSVTFSNQYKDVNTAGLINNEGHADWLGFTDVYWMSVLVPDANAQASTDFRALGGGLYRADLIYKPVAIAPGASAQTVTRLFAGAKEVPVLDRYEKAGIVNFSKSLDWGWFWFFEQPILSLLTWIFHATGNFGVAIILLTLIVRGLMFPVAQRQFASMAAMRAIQPKVKALQERFKEDKAQLQQETMKLYKEEGVNPLAGCLPVFLQIPVFFALYKVLMVSIEMRQAPFVAWIRDLSAPDPLHFLDLFGLIHWDMPPFLMLGPLGLLLGTTMFFQFKLQPSQPDPSQQQVMAIMPWVMMFVMSGFASGLLVYWITSNCLTMGQQAFLYSRHPGLKAQAKTAVVEAPANAKRKT